MSQINFPTYKLTGPRTRNPTRPGNTQVVVPKKSKPDFLCTITDNKAEVLTINTGHPKSTFQIPGPPSTFSSVYIDNDVTVLKNKNSLVVNFNNNPTIVTRPLQETDQFELGGFSTNPDLIGIVTNSKGSANQIKISVIDKQQLQAIGNGGTDGVDSLEGDANNPHVYQDLTRNRPIHATVVDRVIESDRNPKLIVRDAASVKSYQIINDEITLVDTLTGIIGPMDQIGSGEVLMFGKITGKTGHLDCLVRNSNGLYLYQNDGGHQYKLISFDPTFSDQLGWSDEKFLKTLRLYDITEDGLDSLVFTGPNGLQILKYDSSDKIWVTLLENESAQPLQRRFRLLAISKINGQSVIFAETNKNAIQNWSLQVSAPLKEILAQPSAKRQRTEGPRQNFISRAATIRPSNAEPLDSYMLPLKNTLDYNSFMKNNIDLTTGAIKFTIPMMESISRYFNFLALSYDSSLEDSTTVGRGWSMPDQQIVFDDQGSIFPADHRYYLIAYENILEMYLVDQTEEGDGGKREVVKQYFSFLNPETNEDKSGVIVEYDVKKQVWTVPKNDAKYIYGSKTATGYDVLWKLWHGRGDSVDSQVRVPKVWNLAEIRDASDKTLLTLEYESIDGVLHTDTQEPPEHGQIFTRQMVLTSAEDSAGNRLELAYQDKNLDEVNIEKLLIKDGNFEKYTIQMKYLEKYTLICPNRFEQVVDFEYEVRGGQRLLTKITQTQLDAEPVLSFKYENNLLTGIEAPKIMRVGYTHNRFQQNPEPAHADIENLRVELLPNVYHAKDAILVFYLTSAERRLCLKMFSHDGRRRLHEYNDFKMSHIKDYRVLVTDNLFSVLLISDYNKKHESFRELYLFYKNENKEWVMPNARNGENVFDLSGRALVRGGRDYVVYTNEILASNDDGCFSRKRPKQPAVINRHAEVVPPQSSLTHVYWKQGKLITRHLIDPSIPYNESMNDLRQEHIEEEILIATGRNVFVSVASPVATAHFRTSNGEWKMQIIATLRNTLTSTQNVLDKFSLSCTKKSFVMQTFKETALQINDNIVTFYRLAFDDAISTILGNTKVAFLGANYRYKSSDVFNQPKDKILDIRDYSTEGYVYKYDYDPNLKQFRINVSPHPPVETVSQQQFEFINAVENSLSNSLLLNLRDYLAVFESGKFIQNGTVMEFDGSAFINKTANMEKVVTLTYPQKVELTPVMDLQQVNPEGDIYLMNNGNDRINLRINDIDGVKAFLPNYITYDKGSHTYLHRLNTFGEVITFKNQDLSVNFPGEALTKFSNKNVLITSRGELGKMAYLNFRAIQPMVSANTVTQHSLSIYDPQTGFSQPRSTHLFYSEPSVTGSTTIFDKVEVLPGSNNQQYGKISYKNGVNDRSSASIITFNSDHKIVKIEKTGQKNERKDPLDEKAQERLKITTILDQEGEVEILQTFPFKQTNDEVDYFGFEDYENDRDRREYNRENLQRNSFARTGKNFLRLKGIDGFVSAYRPKNQDISYRALTWVRSDNLPPVGSLSPTLKANIYQAADNKYICSVLSTVKVRSEYDNWYLLETIIDLPSLQAFTDRVQRDVPNIIVIKNKVAAKRSAIDNTRERRLIVELSIVPSRDQIIDVDHVLFTPANLQATVNIYDSRLWQLTHKVSTNGLILETLFNKLSNEIGIVNENNQILELTTHTSQFWLGMDSNSIGAHESIITVKGTNGYHEKFSPQSFSKNWKSTPSENNVWEISPTLLRHTGQRSHTITFLPNFKTSSIAVRFFFYLGEGADIQINRHLTLNDQGVVYRGQTFECAYSGEIITIIEGGRLFIIIDGLVLIDNANAADLTSTAENLMITVNGDANINNLLILNDPTATLVYMNSVGEELQKVQLVGNGVVIVRGYENDQLGRKVKETFPQKLESTVGQSPLIQFNPAIMPGKPGLRYRELVYQNDPTTELKYMSVPDSQFSFERGLLKSFIRLPNDEIPSFIRQNYNIVAGFTYQVEQRPGGIRDISVFNSDHLKVARYTYVEGVNGLLSTYQYNQKGQLEKTLPPAYYINLVNLDNIAQMQGNDKMAVKFEYDSSGRKKAFRSPDAGKRETIYNSAGLVKFDITFEYENERAIHTVTFYNYDEGNRLISTGYFKNAAHLDYRSLAELMTEKLIPAAEFPGVVEYQKFEYDDKETDPYLRNKVRRIITLQNEDNPYPYADELVTNFDEKVVTRRIYLPISNDKIRTLEVKKEYHSKYVSKIEYPYESLGDNLQIRYVYDKLGRITGVIGAENKLLAKYEYDAEGSISQEILVPGQKTEIERKFEMNELGLFSSISDKFLDIKLDYSGLGYGSFGYGDGSVTEIRNEAKWHDKADDLSLQVRPESFMKISGLKESEAVECFNKLKNIGVIDENNHQSKIFSEEFHEGVNYVCDHYHEEITKVLGSDGFPRVYGHRYDYGNNNELTKAKYFVGEQKDNIRPLQVSSFKTIFNEQQSQQVWNSLAQNGFILVDNAQGQLQAAHGKKGFTHLIKKELSADLRAASPQLMLFENSIKNILLYYYVKNKQLTEEEFTSFLKMGMPEVDSELSRGYNMLRSRGYLSDPLNPRLHEIFRGQVKQGIAILVKHFTKQLGKCEFDVESYGIDANGNHQRFRTGYLDVALDYEPLTNRVKSASVDNKKFPVHHDSQGNVIVAEHKNIKKIKYHPVVNKISEIQMGDNRVIKFTYDAKSDRSSKRIYHGNKLVKEVIYIRDDNARPMVERETIYDDNGKPMVQVTAYVYGPKGLIGFYRNNNYYNVITDHVGSIRLIELNGEIVAAYDYYPYGGIMRKYEKDPTSTISYRYTGQEFDIETGLYYYIARYYDPEIGRFYQIDPQGQYFSPYKYSGNSPISMVDPDGEFAVLAIVMLVTSAVGAYLGGAAANGSYLPWEWDFKAKETWLGIAGGAIVGALAPVGFMSSAALMGGSVLAYSATTSVGLAFAYYQGVKLTGTFNVLEWDFKDPRLINSLYMGFSDGVSFLSDIVNLRKAHKVVSFFKGLSTTKKLAFIGALSGTFALNTYIGASNRDFNFNDPEIIKEILSGLLTAPFEVRSFSKGLGRFGKRYRSVKTHLKLVMEGTRDMKSYINPDVGSKLIKFTGEVLLATEAVAAKTFDVTTAIHNDEYWNIGGSKAYTAQVQEMLSNTKHERKLWQAAKAYVPRTHYQKITRIQSTPVKYSPDTLARIYQNIKIGRPEHMNDVSGERLTSSVKASQITKRIQRIPGMQDMEMFIFSDALTHIVSFIDRHNRRIELGRNAIDQPEFIEELNEAIHGEMRAERFNRNAVHQKLMSYRLLESGVVDELLREVEDNIARSKPFLGQFNDNLNAELATGLYHLNRQILELKSKELLHGLSDGERRALEDLVRTKDHVGTVNDVEQNFWEHSAEAKSLVTINDNIAKWSVDEKFDNNIVDRCNAPILPTTYKQQDLIYKEGQRSLFSVPLTPCDYCPETIASVSHFGPNELDWTNEIKGTVETRDGLFYEPESCGEKSRIKRSAHNETNSSWIISKINNCLKVLHYFSPRDLIQSYENEGPAATSFTPDYSITDVNSTILLVDMCVRKITGEKYKALNMSLEMNLMKAQVLSMSIVEEVEEMLVELEIGANLDMVELQCKVFEAIAKGSQSKVSGVVFEYLEQHLSDLSFESERKIKKYFNKKCN